MEEGESDRERRVREGVGDVDEVFPPETKKHTNILCVTGGANFGKAKFTKTQIHNTKNVFFRLCDLCAQLFLGMLYFHVRYLDQFGVA